MGENTVDRWLRRVWCVGGLIYTLCSFRHSVIHCPDHGRFFTSNRFESLKTSLPRGPLPAKRACIGRCYRGFVGHIGAKSGCYIKLLPKTCTSESTCWSRAHEPWQRIPETYGMNAKANILSCPRQKLRTLGHLWYSKSLMNSCVVWRGGFRAS